MTASNKRKNGKPRTGTKGYRLALRSVEEWNDRDRMDDVVVNDVSMFRMEQMSANDWWICCYLDDAGNERVTWHARYDKKLRELVIHVTEYPDGDHIYEDQT